MRSVMVVCGILWGCGDDGAAHVTDARVANDVSVDVVAAPGVRVDATFGTNGTLVLSQLGDGFAATLTMLPNDLVLVSVGKQQAFAACRLLGDGTLDPAFGGGACITRNWEVMRGQVAPDGDAVLVAANGQYGPGVISVHRLLADGSDDSSFGPVTLAPPTGFYASTATVAGLRRLPNGTYLAYGVGYYTPTSSLGTWAQVMQASGATSPAVLIAQSHTVHAVVEIAGEPTFIMENLADGSTPVETRAIRMKADLSAPVGDVTVTGRSVQFATSQADGHVLIAQEYPQQQYADAGLWSLDSATGADTMFGTSGLLAGPLRFSTTLELSDGRILATENGNTCSLHLYTSSGDEQAMLKNPYLDTSITDIVQLSNGKILTVAIGLQMVFVQRFTVTP